MATYTVTVRGKEYVVKVVDSPSGGATVVVEGESFDVEPAATAQAPVASSATAAADPTLAAAMPASAAVPHPTATAEIGDSGTIVAPIPGVITAVCVKTGETVAVGQIVLKLEAMKMENDIATPKAGTVKEVAVREGSEVSDGQLLMVIG